MDSNKYISNDTVLDLWRNFRLGNESSFTSLMKIFSQPMFRYGIRFNHDEDFVQDCIQNIFLDLWSRRERIGHTDAVKSYLFKALRTRIFRDKAKWKSLEAIEDNYEFIVEFDVETTLIKEELSQEINHKLHLILDKLPKRQKEILYLRFYEGISQDKIAEIMGLNPQSVYNLLHESINRVRKNWLKSAVYYCL